MARAEKNYNNHTATLPNQLTWASLDQIIRDVLADFVYQGFTKGPKPMVAGMTNNIDNLIKYIEETPEINQHEPGRRRAKYLKDNRQN